MKTSLSKILLDIHNKDFVYLINEFFSCKIGVLKRDFIQNKSSNKKNGIYISTINCMNFLIKSIKTETKIIFLHNIDELSNLKNKILYDFEICNYRFKESLLCIFILLDDSQNVIFIVDIINLFITCITNKNILNIDLGIKNQSNYFSENKIYSLIFNLVRFNKVNEYKRNKYFKLFNSYFRPLYEKTHIQAG